MNKIERVQAALAGGQVDRVPASFWFHFPGKVTGSDMVDAHLAYYRAADSDFVKAMNDNGYNQPAGGPLASADQWDRVEPLPISSPCFQNQLEPLAELCRKLKDEALVVTTVFGPFATARRLLVPFKTGPLSATSPQAGPTLLAHMRERPDLVERGMRAIAESLARFAVECLNAGAAGIFFSAQGSSRDTLTDEEYRRFVQPNDRLILEAVADQGAFNLIHVCGANVRLESYLEMPGQAINWAVQQQNPSISETRDKTDKCIVGGMDERGPLVTGPADAIRAEVQRALAEGGAKKFILGAGCTVPEDVDVSNLRLAREAVPSSGEQP